MLNSTYEQEAEGSEGRGSWLARIPRPLWMSLLLVAITFTTFAKTFDNLFVFWDDNGAIVENPDFNPPTTASLKKFWRDPLHGYRGFYSPVTYTIWWEAAHLDRLPSGDGPSDMPNEHVFHGLNFAFHTTAAVLVFLLLQRLVRADLPALIGAALFAVHPLQVEAVCWASTTYTPLSAALGLGAWLLYLRFTDARIGGKWLWFSAATGLYGLALLTKATVVVFPVMIAIVDMALRGRRLRDCRALLLWLTFGVGAGLLAHHTQPAEGVYVPPIWLRPLVALDAITFYLRKLVLPVGLVAEYSRSPRWVIEHGTRGFCWIAPALLAAIAWRLRRRFAWAWVSLFIFLAGLLPTLGLISFDYQFYSTVADRYAYFAMLGPALALAFLLKQLNMAPASNFPFSTFRFARSAGHPLLPLFFAEIVCFALALLSRAQCAYWHDTRELFGHTLAVNPDSMAAHAQLGFVMMLGQDPDEAEQAIAHYRAALKLFPSNSSAWSNLGVLLMRQHRPAEAADAFRAATVLRPDEAPMRYNLQHALAAAGEEDPRFAATRSGARSVPPRGETSATVSKQDPVTSTRE